MRLLQLSALFALFGMLVIPAQGAEISGEYLEARTCDVYTGPCFANAQYGLAGKEAVMAWKVEKGSWKGIPLSGLGAALIVNSEGTLGYDGVFPMKAGKIRSVILVDSAANEKQQEALVSFVKDSAKDLACTVARVDKAPITLTNDHVEGRGLFEAGKLAKIETRGLKSGDCICTNEMVYYKPLTEVENSHPAFAKTMSFQGEGLNSTWTNYNLRSAYLATFRR